MFKSSSTSFDKLLEKATSLTNLEPDWASIMQICDSIRQNDVAPRYALNAIKKKLNAANPNVQLMALQVLESCVKNCGSHFHYELATRDFMEELHTMLKNSSDSKVKSEILRLVQTWAHAFRKDPSCKPVQDQMRLMKSEGFQFPAFKESDVMFDAETAPEWSDGERCHRCRSVFSMIIRKHHCRNCGQVFCAKCSSKTSTIPKYGIEKEVRVCDHCYEKINKKIEIKSSPTEETKPKFSTTSNSNPTSQTKEKTEQEIQEEEELQLALALSKSEAESREYEKMRASNFSKKTSSGQSSFNHHSSKSHKKSSKSNKTSSSSKSSHKKSSSKDLDIENEDPELARYLNREYWEQRTNSLGDYENSPSPSAPQPNVSTNSTAKIDPVLDMKMIQQNKLTQPMQDDQELDTFTNNLRSTIEIFVNRLNSNKLRGRPITNDNGVQALFMNLTNMHSHLMMYMQQTSEARSNCERLQDKINQIRDARAALDALRDEHREQLKQAAAEAERIRQQQMAQKLEIMRKKKQEYLQYQRELALQRMQEQERELMMRTEQLKFASAQVSAGVQPQWNMAPGGPTTAASYPQPTGPNTYYIDNSANSYAPPVHEFVHQPGQQPPGTMVAGQPMMSATGQYGPPPSTPASMPQPQTNNVPGMVGSSSQASPMMHQPIHGHMMAGQMISGGHLCRYPTTSQQAMTAPKLYMTIVPTTRPFPQPDMANQQPSAYGTAPEPPPQQPPAKEELLINFD